MEKFKEFVIAPVDGMCKNSWELRRYSPDNSTHIIIAFIRYKNDSFNIESVAMRLLKYGTSEMKQWVLAWVNYRSIKRRLEGEN